MDTQQLGILCARAMEMLAERYADSDDATLHTVALVLEVEHDDETAEVLVTGTDPRLWVQAAFLKEGVWTLEREIERQETAE